MLEVPIFIQTRDGSWTTRLKVDGAYGEAMHNLNGAWGETKAIYGRAFDTATANAFPPTVLSVGLGLGYNELFSVAQLGTHPQFYCHSMESVQSLRQNFSEWLLGRDRWSAIYDDILARIQADCRQLELKSMAKNALLNGSLYLDSELRHDRLPQRKFSIILFDAFSAKSSPELWNESFLVHFLGQVAAPQCVLSTYACTSVLKKALNQCGFELHKKPGYFSKRDSTLATRMN